MRIDKMSNPFFVLFTYHTVDAEFVRLRPFSRVLAGLLPYMRYGFAKRSFRLDLVFSPALCVYSFNMVSERQKLDTHTIKIITRATRVSYDAITKVN